MTSVITFLFSIMSWIRSIAVPHVFAAELLLLYNLLVRFYRSESFLWKNHLWKLWTNIEIDLNWYLMEHIKCFYILIYCDDALQNLWWFITILIRLLCNILVKSTGQNSEQTNIGTSFTYKELCSKYSSEQLIIRTPATQCCF